MNVSLKITLHVLLGILLGFVIYVLPDTMGNPGELVSAIIKGIWIIAFLVMTVAARSSRDKGGFALMLSAGLTLALLLAFGGYIRFAELY